MTKPLIVIALGGNALQSKNEKLTIETQIKNSQKVAKQIVPLLKKYKIVLTYGNGPQVGNCVIRVEQSLGKAYKLPLDVCVADSEGEIGYILEQAFLNEFQKNKIKHGVATLLTQVLVDKKDKAFKNPSKPIGNFYSKSEIIKTKKSYVYQKEKDRSGYRVVVPSPKPIKIIESETIKNLIKDNTLVICAGGGGIPVIEVGNGKKKKLKGVEAVIDKDFASSCLAKSLNADLFVILTGEEFVYLNYKKPNQKILRKLNIRDAQKYLLEGQFPKGSMGPKIESAIEFLKSGGKRVIITSPTKLKQSLLGKAGTLIQK